MMRGTIPTPFQPNATLRVDNDGGLVVLPHMSRDGSFYTVTLTRDATEALIADLVDALGMTAKPKPRC